MVVHIAAATRAATAASQAGATALGLGLGKTDLDLAQIFFKQQMQQTKRLWTADYAEASIRHGESCTQSARQHAESQAAANAAYFQAERLAGQSIRLARDQDSRAYEMAWRAEVRESLRDELGNQNNRFNIIMLCNTVCLGCVFSLAADGTPPTDTSSAMLNAYIFCLGVSIMLFTASLWGSVIVVRRLHDNTAARLEQKLFIQSEDLQNTWKDQLKKNKPTGPQEIYLVNKSYEKWVSNNIDPIGMATLNMLSLGVVTMFVTAGLLMHNRYLIEYKNASIYIPIIFWSIVVITSSTVLYMKFSEDKSEKKKAGAYDVSWQDESVQSMMGPFAKIRKAGEALSCSTATELGSAERINSLINHEENERSFCAQTQSLYGQADALFNESSGKTAVRKEILALLTSAAEEYDTLPQDFITRLNKVVHRIDEADERISAHLNGVNKNLSIQKRDTICIESNCASSCLRNQSFNLKMPQSNKLMPMHPIDSQRIPLVLGPLRARLGEIPITTLLRLKNTSIEPLRLKSGLQLKEGKYISSITTNDPTNNSVTYQMYPPSEIPPRTEIAIACRSRGGWIATSGIDGEIVYTDRDESWIISIKFRNPLIGHDRECKVDANYFTKDETGNAIATVIENKKFWDISKVELDHKSNNEFVITMNCCNNPENCVGTSSTKASRMAEAVVNKYKNRDHSPLTDYPTDSSVECVFHENNHDVILPV